MIIFLTLGLFLNILFHIPTNTDDVSSSMLIELPRGFGFLVLRYNENQIFFSTVKAFMFLEQQNVTYVCLRIGIDFSYHTDTFTLFILKRKKFSTYFPILRQPQKMSPKVTTIAWQLPLARKSRQEPFQSQYKWGIRHTSTDNACTKSETPRF